MRVQLIPAVIVSYNASALLRDTLVSFRRHYPDNPVHVVDGSEPGPAAEIHAVCEGLPGVTLHAVGYNIHHGPGMAWAIQTLGLHGPVLFLDSDIVTLQGGWLENLHAALQPGDYGVGCVAFVNQDGFDCEYGYGVVPYLHPPCMLCDVDVMRQWPLPVKHGAPMVAAMKALHRSGQSKLLRHMDWVANDIATGKGARRVFIDHIGQGTVRATGGYHLDEWMAEIRAKKQAETVAPPAQGLNRDLLALVPATARRVLEVGCSTGALAYAFKTAQPDCDYRGIELDERAAADARRWCDGVDVRDMDAMCDADFAKYADRDCWIFGDVLEHLRDPWQVLARIRRVLPDGGCVVASVPNAQHWSIQARLAVGDFRYSDAGGLMDRTHIRWFTRLTLLEMFSEAGFRLDAGVPRIFNEPQRERALPAIRLMAQSQGLDPEQVVKDALPLQYVIRMLPA